MPEQDSVPDILKRHAAERGDRIAFFTSKRAISYSELEERTRKLAQSLKSFGIQKGQIVAVVLSRCIEAIESTFAITRAGAIGAPLDPRTPSRELSKLLSHSGARLVITDEGRYASVRGAIEESVQILVTGPQDRTYGDHEGKTAFYSAWAETEERSDPNIAIDNLAPDDDAFLLYTSGTTGTAKGILSHQKSWLSNIRSLAPMLSMTPDDQIFWPLPLFHSFGLSFCILATISVGACAHLSEAEDNHIEALLHPQASRTTMIVGTPATFHNLVDFEPGRGSKPRLNLPRLRLCMSGGSPIPRSLMSKVDDMFGVPLVNNYGSTEACGAIGMGLPDDLHREASKSAVVPCWEIELRDQEGNVVPEGKSGELCVRRSSLTLKFHGKPESPLTPDGWFETGDIAIRSTSTSGVVHLTLIGRKKELIMRGGENIEPQEVENVLLQMPEVADVVVAAIPHLILGEVPAAFLVREQKCSPFDVRAVIDKARSLLPDHKVPTLYYDLDAIPRTQLGKPKRLDTSRQTERPLSGEQFLQTRDSIEELVVAETVNVCIADNTHRQRVYGDEQLRRHLDEPFSYLGLDSMGAIILRDRLAGITGLDLPKALVFDFPTPAAVRDYLVSCLLKTEPPYGSSEKVKSRKHDHAEPIAIVSMACRYPGGVSSPEDLWNLVINEVDATTDMPQDRGWDIESLYNPDPDAPGTSMTRRGGFLHDLADFDANLFRMAPREALATDPQQRLLLETTWELAERGGIAPSSLKGSQTGVFVGLMYDDYEKNGAGHHELEGYLNLGSASSVAAGRLSYYFGLEGPSIAINTACSSSSVGIHLACQSLRSKECTLAIAGGATTMATPAPFIMFSKRRGLSPDGRCRAYSADANGTGWSEGVGLLLLERQSDAKQNGHHIHALIPGSAVNSDGASNGLTAPSGLAQQACIRSALHQAEISPEAVDVLEGHGTATQLGDSIEMEAVKSVYGNEGKARCSPLLLGSMKSNIGHTQAAAGVAGVIKMVQAMNHGIVPRSLHISKPLDCGRTDIIELLTRTRDWPLVGRPKRAAVSSFGIGGTNSVGYRPLNNRLMVDHLRALLTFCLKHIILEQQPEPVEEQLIRSDGHQASLPWIISGFSGAALRDQAKSLLSFCQNPSPQKSNDIAYTLATARSSLEFKAVVSCTNQADWWAQAQLALEAIVNREAHPDLRTGQASPTGSRPRLAFLFSGQGSDMPSGQRFRELASQYGVFYEGFRAAAATFDKHLDYSLEAAIMDNTGSIKDPINTQATLFVYQVAICRLLASFKVLPDRVSGHSLGEIAAAHVSGSLSLDEAVHIVVTRAKLMAKLPANGAMLSISASESEVNETISEFEGQATVAAVNSATSTVVSGTKGAISSLNKIFVASGRKTAQLRNVDHGYHSPMMEEVLPFLANALDTAFGPSTQKGAATTPAVPLVSTVTGGRIDTGRLRSSKHWTDHVISPVRFSKAVDTLQSAEGSSTFLEIGPSAILAPHVPGCASTGSSHDKLLTVLGNLWAQGVEVDWKTVFETTGAQLCPLPTYAFQRERYWLPFKSNRPAKREPQIGGSSSPNFHHPILSNAISIAGTGKIVCSGSLSVSRQPWLRDHFVGGKQLVPAAVFLELATKAAQECPEISTLGDPVLQEVTIISPLIMNALEAFDYKIQVVIGSHGNDGVGRGIDIYSRLESTGDEEWLHHVTGTIAWLSTARPSEDGMSSDGLHRPSGLSEADISAGYLALRELAIEYGPNFQRVRAVRPHGNHKIVVDLDNTHRLQTVSAFLLHPTVLDAAFHALALTTALEDPQALQDKIKLPFSFRGVQIFDGADSAETIEAWIQITGPDTFFVALKDKKSRQEIARISEVQLRASTRSETVGGDLYHLKWVEAIGETYPEAVESPTDEWVRADFSKRFDNTDVVAAVHVAVSEALGTVQNWRRNQRQRRLIIVTERATLPSNSESPMSLVAAAVWGFLRSAQAEYGGQIVLIDLDGSAESEEALRGAVASMKEVVAVRSGKLLFPELCKVPQPAASYANGSDLDVRGTVLITGASGGLGALMTRHIAQRYKAQSFLLASRSGPKADSARELCTELEDAGAHVCMATCDVSNRAQLVNMLDNHRQKNRPITAVIHCAGIIDDAIVSRQTNERIAEVLRPKVDAAWNLHELVPEARSFVLFSSFVSILGNTGQVAYTAANNFLNSLASYRTAQGLPGVSLAWGPWANSRSMTRGLLTPGGQVDHPEISNAMPLTDNEGLNLFDNAMALQALDDPEPVIVPLRLQGPFPLLKPTETQALKRTVPKHSSWKQKFKRLSDEEQSEALSKLVCSEIATVLGYSEGEIRPDHSLLNIGFDSHTSVSLSGRLKSLIGLEQISSTLALDHTTPSQVTMTLLKGIRAAPPEWDGEHRHSTVVERSRAAVATNGGPGEAMAQDFKKFQGLSDLFRSLFEAGQFYDATALISSASAVLKTARNSSKEYQHFSMEPYRLASGKKGGMGTCPSLVLIAPILSRLRLGSSTRSPYSALASFFEGQRDVFELVHPDQLVVPKDIDTLIALHIRTIQEHFSKDDEIILGGYSAGGTIAYSIASRLACDSAITQPRVVGLVLVDTYLDMRMSSRSNPAWFQALPLYPLATMLKLEEHGDGEKPLFGNANLELAKTGGYFAAFRDWRIDLFPIPPHLSTLLVRAGERAQFMPPDDDTWRTRWPAAKTVVDVAGHHLELLDKSCASGVGKAIENWSKQHDRSR